MDRSHARRPRELTPDEIDDAQDLRSVIVTALSVTPVDQESLRHAVWTYVRAERDVGARPGTVIGTLTDIVEASSVAPRSARDERRVILWCVEAYFGHLGGEGVGRQCAPAAGEASLATPRIVSNR